MDINEWLEGSIEKKDLKFLLKKKRKIPGFKLCYLWGKKKFNLKQLHKEQDRIQQLLYQNKQNQILLKKYFEHLIEMENEHFAN